MAGVLTDGGIQDLNTLLATAIDADGTYEVGLFCNNHTPAVGDTLSVYTEASFGGYTRYALTGAVDGGVTGNVDLQTFMGVVFTVTAPTGPSPVYGYFVVKGTLLIGAELFVVPVALTTAGQEIQVVPTLSYQDRSIP